MTYSMKNGLKMFSHRKCFFLFAKLLLLGIFLFPQIITAQERSISGTVTGVNNDPLPGVSVTIKGNYIRYTDRSGWKIHFTTAFCRQNFGIQFYWNGDKGD